MPRTKAKYVPASGGVSRVTYITSNLRYKIVVWPYMWGADVEY